MGSEMCIRDRLSLYEAGVGRSERLLALLCLKAAVDRRWNERKEAAVGAEEKAGVRARLLAACDETESTLASQVGAVSLPLLPSPFTIPALCLYLPRPLTSLCFVASLSRHLWLARCCSCPSAHLTTAAVSCLASSSGARPAGNAPLKQIVLIVANIARLEGLDAWPELLPALTAAAARSEPVEAARGLAALYRVIKLQVARRRPPSARAASFIAGMRAPDKPPVSALRPHRRPNV